MQRVAPSLQASIPVWTIEIPNQLAKERLEMVRKSITQNPHFSELSETRQLYLIEVVEDAHTRCSTEKVALMILNTFAEDGIESEICKEALKGKTRYDFALVTKLRESGEQTPFREFLVNQFEPYFEDKKSLRKFTSCLLLLFFTKDTIVKNGKQWKELEQIIKEKSNNPELVTHLFESIIRSKSTGEYKKYLLEKREQLSLEQSAFLVRIYSKTSGWEFHLNPSNKLMDFENHTLNIPSYLQNRFSKTLIDFIQRDPSKTEVFIGSEEDEKDYHAVHTRYNFTGRFKNPTSFTFNFYENLEGDDNDFKIVIGGISSASRLKHLFFILSAFGISTSDIKIRGTFDHFYESEVRKLDAFIEGLKSPPSILILGGSSSFSSALEKRFSGEYRKGTISKEFNIEIGEITSKDSSSKVIAMMRMPNGDLAYHYTIKLMEKGVSTVLLLGAGGTFMEHIAIGDYQPIYHSYYDDTTYHLPLDNILHLEDKENCLSSIISNRECHHVTVDTPLEETREWLASHESFCGAVDVETAHVFRAFLKAITHNPQAMIFPGLFISDNIVKSPLEGKIGAQAYSNLDRVLFSLVNRCIAIAS